MPDKVFYLVEEPLYSVVKEMSGPFVEVHPIDKSVLRYSPPGEIAVFWRKPLWSTSLEEVLEEALKRATFAADRARIALADARMAEKSLRKKLAKL